jgi:hypothetical protein
VLKIDVVAKAKAFLYPDTKVRFENETATPSPSGFQQFLPFRAGKSKSLKSVALFILSTDGVFTG